MISQDIERLRSIKSFPSLVKYLRDELDWPIESEDFDELTFEYEPEELGIDAKTAVKIKEIKQLRPLSSKQPWGIFFINFEPKQLPIVVLRRILRSLVLNKRASAKKSQQAAWQLHDLLFISSYGETDHREITFAHFSEPTDRLFGDLPTLRVLGWDDDDTKLKIEHVVHTLFNKMRWPADENNTEAWRKKWSDAFELRPREVITTSKDLALRLADLAKSIRQRANLILRVESERGPLRMLHKAFQAALIHDISEDDFADMYAQTIAYGLLAARVSRPAGVISDNLADMIPANPFLRDMLGTFLSVGGRKGKIDFDELGIQEVVDLLNNPDTHIEAVLRDFGKKTMHEDPVIHFYELFLNEYDKKKKVQRGVFYTPQPVVSHIVRSVHELLQTEFGLEDGLASTMTWGEMHKMHPEIKIPKGVSIDEPFVQILDPATGTATFLVEVIEIIYKTMTKKWLKEGHMALEIPKLWNKYVPKHLLPRLYGFELMMAPYAIAHMKIGLKLGETGYRFGSEERAHIYLTNSLEPPSDVAEQPQFEEMAPALAHEAKAVNAIKCNKLFTVVIGNPPYSNFGQLNRIPFILSLLEDYKRDLDEQKLNLDDDYIKFIRFGQYVLDKAGTGIFGMITNNVYMDGITHRRMRESMKSSFACVRVLDLHGSVKKLEISPDGSKDENVFDIQQGVGISLFSKVPHVPLNQVEFSELWGSREAKYVALTATGQHPVQGTKVESVAPYHFFVPKNFSDGAEWNTWHSIRVLMPANSTGVKTHLDDVLVRFEKTEIKTVIEHFLDENWKPIELSKTRRASPLRKAVLLKNALKDDLDRSVADYAYRVFDTRKIAYLPNAIEAGDHRYPIMRHLLSSNVGIATTRQLSQGSFAHILVTKFITDMCFLSTATKECAYIFPLKLLAGGNLLKGDSVSWNLSSYAQTYCLQNNTTPEDFFQYTYAVFHSSTYRNRYAEFLKIDFPRVPLTSSLELFKALAKLGGELVALHLMESPKLNKHITRFVGKGKPEVEKVSYSDETVWIDKAQSQGFQGVPENVWNFHIGGYQVCEKWLKNRKGRTLSADDINHYHRIVVALNETIHIMAEIDKVIEVHGGWPNAFSTKEEKDSSRYDVQSQPALKAAEEMSEYKKQKNSTTHPKLIPLKKDWRTWFALSQWAKQTTSINTYWGDFAMEISNIIKAGKQLSSKQKENMDKFWKQAVKNGFIPKR
jgi:hypothetical protein